MKAPYSIRIAAPQPLVAVAAGTHVKDTTRTSSFWSPPSLCVLLFERVQMMFVDLLLW